MLLCAPLKFVDEPVMFSENLEQIEALMVPAGSHVKLQPGGYHVMLMNLKEPLVVGEVHSMTLVFSDGTTLDVEVPVKPLVEMHNEHAHH